MTEKANAPYLVEVRGEEVLQIRNDLDCAVDRAVNHAIKVGGYGVLVTQHSFTFYTVALNKDVPYGQIRERRRTDFADAALN